MDFIRKQHPLQTKGKRKPRSSCCGAVMKRVKKKSPLRFLFLLHRMAELRYEFLGALSVFSFLNHVTVNPVHSIWHEATKRLTRTPRWYGETCPLNPACSQKCDQEHINGFPVRQEHVNRFQALVHKRKHADKLEFIKLNL